MDFSNQQNQALQFFNKTAKAWGERASGVFNNEVNMIQQRNEYVLWSIERREKTNRVLDVGCGTGDLIHSVAEKGIESVGIDFAPEMIRVAEEKWSGDATAKFICDSIFTHDFGDTKFDVISANGFIEYISFNQFHEFLKLSYDKLEANGSLVFGSRNRLFNIFSLNKFTTNEIEQGTVEDLLKESIALVSAEKIEDVFGVQPVAMPDPEKAHPNTGVEVNVRYQFTPVQLMKMLQEHGFETVHISPIHIHGTTPKFKDFYPEAHKNISNLLQGYAYQNMSLIPFASSFMIHAKKI